MVEDLGNPGSKSMNGTKSTINNGTATRTKKHYLNFGEEDQMEILGYRGNDLKKYITYMGYIFTFGLLRLLYHWVPQWHLYSTYSQCPLTKAEKLLIIDQYKNKYKTYFVKEVEELTASGSGLKRTDSIISLNGQIYGKDNEQDKLLSIYLCDGTRKSLSKIRVVRCKKLLYVWDENKYKFIKLCGLDKGVDTKEFHTRKGYSYEEQQRRRTAYGINEINVPVQSILTLIVLEALTPFYMFQVFSLVVWLAEAYYYYTIAIIVMSVFGISTSVIQTRKNQKNLKGTVQTVDNVVVSRGDGTFDEIPTTDLVPGDLIVIPSHGCDMPCDAVLLNGSSIVNESMLTGESVPVTKTALPNNDKRYDPDEHKNHTLFCGTRIIQTRNYTGEEVVAVVTRTGFLTTKGQLVRSILYPPPADFKFDQDSYKFIMILAFVALCGFVFTIFYKYSRDVSAFDIIIKALDLITIAIPPALPAAMTVGKLYALNRLKKQRIFCINSRVINVSGSIDCLCFDKTGTLTEDGLDMWGVVPVENHIINETVDDANIKEHAQTTTLFRGMLTCHSLTLIDGNLCGDPLDVKMFESTGWILEEPTIPDTSKYDLLVPAIVKQSNSKSNHLEIGLVQQYQFSSTLQRMSVVCRVLGSDYFEVFAKGSPEMIISLSRPETVPEGILERLKQYTEKGYRVIGMGSRILHDVPFHNISKLNREEVEIDLDFVGLIILENRLKPQTVGVIDTLARAGLKIVMITGDNVQTAISVARECGIIQPGYTVLDVVTTKPNKQDMAKIKFQEIGTVTTISKNIQDIEKAQERKYQFVVSGTAWAHINDYFPDLIPKIITKGVVFARMSGPQKQQLVEELQVLGYYVAMCGDGANDCGALKAANVGISLSEAESSVASPFTSQEPDISCTTKVIKEGRAALTTSFGVLKFMICYSLTEFTSCILLYFIDSNLTSLQFLFIDIFLVLNFASFFGNAKAHEHLHNGPPMTSLLSFIPMMSMSLFMLIVIGVQVGAFYAIQIFDWFTPFVFNSSNTTYYTCFENYAVFSVSMFQYIIMAFVFSKGKPYRKPIYTNYIFLSSIILMTAVCSYMTLNPAQWIIDALELKVPPQYDGRVAMIIMAIIMFFICVIVEEVVVEFVLHKKVLPRVRKIDKSRQYLIIENELKNNQNWPNTRTDVYIESVNESSYSGAGVVNNGYSSFMDHEKM